MRIGPEMGTGAKSAGGIEQDDGEEGEGEEQGGAWGETAAIGGRIAAAGGSGSGGGAKVTAPPRSVMQGFLRKRVAGRLWGASEGWEYRWVVLRVSEWVGGWVCRVKSVEMWVLGRVSACSRLPLVMDLVLS